MGRDFSTRKEAELNIENTDNRCKLLSELSFEGILVHENGIALEMNETFGNGSVHDFFIS